MKTLIFLMLIPLAAFGAPLTTPIIEPVDVLDSCQVTGCSSQGCAKAAGVTTCEFLPHYECYALGHCGPNARGQCMWSGQELAECLTAHGVCPERHEPVCAEGEGTPICLVGRENTNGCPPVRYCICGPSNISVTVVDLLEDPAGEAEPVTVISVNEGPIDLDFGRPEMPPIEFPNWGPLAPQTPF